MNNEKEKIINEIKSIEEEIKITKKYNSCSGELSFLYWQLNELKKELKMYDVE